MTHQSVTLDSQTMKVQTENLPYFHNADEEAARDHERLEGDERVIFVTFFFIECINILNVCVLCFGNKSFFEGSSNTWRFFAPISLSPVESASSQKSRAHHPHFFSFSGLDDFLSSPKSRLPFLFIVPLCSLSAFPQSFCKTRSYAALRAADLEWIVGPGYSLGGYILEKNHEKPTWNHEKT